MTSKFQSSKKVFNHKDASQITIAKEYVSQCVTLIDVKHQYIYTNNVFDLYLLDYATGLSSNDDIINLSGFTSNNVSVSNTTDAIIDVNGSTKNLDSQTVPEEISIHHDDFKSKNILILFAWT